MTIRIEVKNDDNRPGAIVKVMTQARLDPTTPFMDVPGVERRLHGQDKSVFWVHGNQRLVIEEVEPQPQKA